MLDIFEQQFDVWGQRILGIVMIAVGIGLLLFVGLLVALAWFTLVWLYQMYRYYQYRREAERLYHAVERELGADYKAEDVLRSVFGAGIDIPAAGRRTGSDFIGHTIFGVEVDRW